MLDMLPKSGIGEQSCTHWLVHVEPVKGDISYLV